MTFHYNIQLQLSCGISEIEYTLIVVKLSKESRILFIDLVGGVGALVSSLIILYAYDIQIYSTA